MKHLTAAALLLGLGLTTGCNKPSEESCRKAIANMQSLLGTEHLTEGQDMQGEVRRCKGGSSKEAVECAIAAKSLEQLKACDFMKVPSTTSGK